MKHFKEITTSYAFDKGHNLIQSNRQRVAKKIRMITASKSNRAIEQAFYNSLNLSPYQKSNLDITLINTGIFDNHGNQNKTRPNQKLLWDYRNMQLANYNDLQDGNGMREYSVFAKSGQRNRKVIEKINSDKNIYEIAEVCYLGNLEYRCIWRGTNLAYDGETVTETSTGEVVAPYEKFKALRIRQGHRQVIQKKEGEYENGHQESNTSISFNLDNNIDSCELTLSDLGQLESYESYKPYGETAVMYGQTNNQAYKYSGQEKDQSGLYYYGFRNLDSKTFRWTSPDPLGLSGSGLHWYAMTNGNPVSMRDENGLLPSGTLFSHLMKTLLVIAVVFSKHSEASNEEVAGVEAKKFRFLKEAAGNATLVLANSNQATQYAVGDVHHGVRSIFIIKGIAKGLRMNHISYDIGTEGIVGISKQIDDPKKSAGNWVKFRNDFLNLNKKEKKDFIPQRLKHYKIPAQKADNFFTYVYYYNKRGIAAAIKYSRKSQKAMIHHYGTAHFTHDAEMVFKLLTNQLDGFPNEKRGITMAFNDYLEYGNIKFGFDKNGNRNHKRAAEIYATQFGLFDQLNNIKKRKAPAFLFFDQTPFFSKHVYARNFGLDSSFFDKYQTLRIPYGNRNEALLIMGLPEDFKALNETLFAELGAKVFDPRPYRPRMGKKEL